MLIYGMSEVISRAEAKAQGLKTFFTGNPCPRGHFSPRRVINYSCVACNTEKTTERYRALPRNHPTVLKIRERARAWAVEHPERARQRLKDWTEAHKEYLREYRAKHREKENERRRLAVAKDPDYYRRKYNKRKDDPEYRRKAKERSRKYRIEHPEKAMAAVLKWMKEHPEAMRDIRRTRAIRERAAGEISVADLREVKARGKCQACGNVHPHMEVDHIVPVSRGGMNHLSNLQLLCRPCNRSKWAHDNDEWLKSQITASAKR